jgi:hypothetical protein
VSGELWEIVRIKPNEDEELVDVGTPEEVQRKMNHLAGQIGVPLFSLGEGIAFQNGDVTVTAGPASKRTVEALRELVQRHADEEE